MTVGIVRSEFISHLTGMRVRVNGSGTLRPTIFGQDTSTTQVLATLTMAATNRFSAFFLANVIEQSYQVQLQTTEIDDDFTIYRIILYSKPVFTQTPG